MAYRQLNAEERHRLAAMRAQGMQLAVMARELRRHRSTLYREVARNRSTYDGAYRATPAMQKTQGRRRRSRRNARYGPAQFAAIERLLRLDWSPAQIVGWRKRQGAGVMSHETIYRWIWADKQRGGTLWQHLRGARKQRRKRYGRYDSRGRLAGKRLIVERPKIVARRARLGDWEIDTVHGRGKACVVTVVERKSGLVRVGKLPRASGQHTLRRTVQLLQAERHPVRTITADNGTEFHIYKALERRLGTRLYFATPHHAWERGTNENTNGLIRQYLPRGTNLQRLTQPRCAQIAAKLNNRPRLRLNFRTPNEVYHGTPASRRPSVAACGKPLGSCPRPRPMGYPPRIPS
jgi:IS30 family transposase